MPSVSSTTITELEPVLQPAFVGGDWIPCGLEEYVRPKCPDGPVAWFSASAEVELFFIRWRSVCMDRVE